MHLADPFILSDVQCIQAIHFFLSMCVSWKLNPQPFALLTQCSTTEPQEQVKNVLLMIFFYYKHSFSLHKTLIDEVEVIHCNATFLHINSDEETISSTFWIA